MTGKHLKGSKPILPPHAARALYARDKTVIPWSDEKDALVLRQFTELRDIWKFDPKPDSDWDTAKAFTTESGRVAFKGQCNDFAPALKRALVAAGLSEEALSLVLCRFDGQGHMVLAIETDQGTLICCQLAGCWALGRPALRHHDWIAREAPGRAWESLEPLDLSDLMGGDDKNHKVPRV